MATSKKSAAKSSAKPVAKGAAKTPVSKAITKKVADVRAAMAPKPAAAAPAPVAKPAPSQAAPKRRMVRGSAVIKPGKEAPLSAAEEAALAEQSRKAGEHFAQLAKSGGKAAPKAAAAPKAEKPKRVVVQFTPRQAAKGTVLHAIADDGARPQSGTRLFAHTHAALTMLGLLSDGRPAVPERMVLNILGQRAVNYHRKQGNFESAPDHTLRLSVSGLNNFRNRMTEGKVDGACANGFLSIFLDGKPTPETGVQPGKVYVVGQL